MKIMNLKEVGKRDLVDKLRELADELDKLEKSDIIKSEWKVSADTATIPDGYFGLRKVPTGYVFLDFSILYYPKPEKKLMKIYGQTIVV